MRIIGREVVELGEVDSQVVVFLWRKEFVMVEVEFKVVFGIGRLWRGKFSLREKAGLSLEFDSRCRTFSTRSLVSTSREFEVDGVWEKSVIGLQLMLCYTYHVLYWNDGCVCNLGRDSSRA
jgi:hypothetical protein